MKGDIHLSDIPAVKEIFTVDITSHSTLIFGHTELHREAISLRVVRDQTGAHAYYKKSRDDSLG